MKLKYYLRGLGIGIFVTAVIFSIAFQQQGRTISDEEIQRRASELGMVMQDTSKLVEETQEAESVIESSEVQETVSESSEVQETVSESSEVQETVSESLEVQETETVSESSEAQETMVESSEAQETETTEQTTLITGEVDAETVTLIVNSGDSSQIVAKRAQEIGLVDDASAFDAFLCANNYDNRISVGSYDISLGTSDQVIAQIITRTNN